MTATSRAIAGFRPAIKWARTYSLATNPLLPRGQLNNFQIQKNVLIPTYRGAYRTIHQSAHTNSSTATTNSLSGLNDTDFTSVYPTGVADPSSVLDSYNKVWLRDACPGSCCVDKSSKQKRFHTSEIPDNVGIKSWAFLPNGSVQVTWTNDLPTYGPDHVSLFPASFFRTYQNADTVLEDRSNHQVEQLWDKSKISRDLKYIDYDNFMKTDTGLYQTLWQLKVLGLVFIKGVPSSEESVVKMTDRIGHLRNTFYGRTWDVRSVSQATNVAYTSQFLDFHMDLLYMSDPPGLQLLHCIENKCEGGSALFSDSFQALSKLSNADFHILAEQKSAYHYRNAGEHYYFERPTVEIGNVEVGQDKGVGFVNWSPPFQANYNFTGEAQHKDFPQLMRASKSFAAEISKPENVYKHGYREGECVIFNNRRVLHAREEFDTNTGNRWLKGTYVDTDVFLSRYRVLHEKLHGYP
jgi:gamma-butyrobetaine dioxygenase